MSLSYKAVKIIQLNCYILGPEEYKVMIEDTNECTMGFDQMTYEQCEAYAASEDIDNFAGYYQEDGYYQYARFSKATHPKGCIRDNTSRASFIVQFNEHTTGSNNRKYSPVCINNRSPAPTSPSLTPSTSPTLRTNLNRTNRYHQV